MKKRRKSWRVRQRETKVRAVLTRTRAALIATFPDVWIQPTSEGFEVRELGIFWTTTPPVGLTSDPVGSAKVGWPSPFRDRSSSGAALTHEQLRVLSDYIAARTPKKVP